LRPTKLLKLTLANYDSCKNYSEIILNTYINFTAILPRVILPFKIFIKLFLAGYFNPKITLRISKVSCIPY